MPTITKKDLIDRIAQNTQAKKSLVKATVQSFLDEIMAELAKGNRLEFRDFGVFQVRETPPRILCSTADVWRKNHILSVLKETKRRKKR